MIDDFIIDVTDRVISVDLSKVDNDEINWAINHGIDCYHARYGCNCELHANQNTLHKIVADAGINWINTEIEYSTSGNRMALYCGQKIVKDNTVLDDIVYLQ